MAKLSILRYPDPRLHTVAKPVQAVDARIQRLVEDMAETMYAAPGIGLAATQVNVHERVIAIDISEDHTDLKVLINPEIIEKHGDLEWEEGCLSVPGIYEKVHRAEKIKVRALNRYGETYEFEADGLLAVCVQHEMDHLLGKVFVEYLSRLKRNRIKTKLLKEAREKNIPSPDAQHLVL
jgi:peptide deformylase